MTHPLHPDEELGTDPLLRPQLAGYLERRRGDLERVAAYLAARDLVEGAQGRAAVEILRVEAQVLAQQLLPQCPCALRVPERGVQLGVLMEGALGHVGRGDRAPGVVDQRQLRVHVDLVVMAVSAAGGDRRQREVLVTPELRQLLEEERGARYEQFATRLAEAANSRSWDGHWFLRGYYDDGTPLGGGFCPMSSPKPLDCIKV